MEVMDSLDIYPMFACNPRLHGSHISQEHWLQPHLKVLQICNQIIKLLLRNWSTQSNRTSCVYNDFSIKQKQSHERSHD